MPRHIIRFTEETKNRLAEEINKELRKVKWSRYGSEPNYTPAMVQQLEGFEFENSECKVKIEGAVMTSTGPSSAEKWSGADCSIVAKIIDKTKGILIVKGTLAQAKRGSVENFSVLERQRLEEQIENMKKIVLNPKVIEVPESDGKIPSILSATGILAKKALKKQDFGRWVSRRVLPTFDGDTSEGIAEKILDSGLSSIWIVVNKRRSVFLLDD
jgi:hypothetical protein